MPRYDPQTALIVVDIQNDFAHPRGSLFVAGAAQVIANANAELTRASDAGALVVYTQDWHPPHTPHFEQDGGAWPVHCVADSWGAQFHTDLISGAGLVVRKGIDGHDGYSGFTTRDPQRGERTATELAELLREAGVERCIVVGLATDYCVKETAADAIRLGFHVTVPGNAVAAVNLDPDDGARARSELTALGVEIE